MLNIHVLFNLPLFKVWHKQPFFTFREVHHCYMQLQIQTVRRRWWVLPTLKLPFSGVFNYLLGAAKRFSSIKVACISKNSLTVTVCEKGRARRQEEASKGNTKPFYFYFNKHFFPFLIYSLCCHIWQRP